MVVRLCFFQSLGRKLNACRCDILARLYSRNRESGRYGALAENGTELVCQRLVDAMIRTGTGLM